MLHRIVRLTLGLALVPWLVPSARAQGVPDSIVAEGVPEVPASLVEALNRYQNIRTAAFQGWLAGRREVLIATRFAETPQVHHVAFPGGARTQLTFGRDRVLGAAPRPGRDQFAFSADAGAPRIISSSSTTSAPGRSSGSPTASRGTCWASGPTPGRCWPTAATPATARTWTSTSSIPRDPARPGGSRTSRGTGPSPTGRPTTRTVAAIEYLSINESYVHLVDVATGEARTPTPRAAPGGPTVAYGDVRFSRDGKAIYWTTDLGSEFRRLARHDLASRRLHDADGPHPLGRGGLRPVRRRHDDHPGRQRGRGLAAPRARRRERPRSGPPPGSPPGRSRAWSSAAGRSSSGSAWRRRGPRWTSTRATWPPARSSAGRGARRAGSTPRRSRNRR